LPIFIFVLFQEITDGRPLPGDGSASPRRPSAPGRGVALPKDATKSAAEGAAPCFWQEYAVLHVDIMG
jgi:hypothetical protein